MRTYIKGELVMTKKEIFIPFKLEKITEVVTEGALKTTLKYTPTKEDFKKIISLVIRTSDPFDTAQRTGIPGELGDTFEMCIGKTNTQEKIKI